MRQHGGALFQQFQQQQQQASPQPPAPEYGATHTPEHRAWKTAMNAAFADALKQLPAVARERGTVLVLDDDAQPAFGTSRHLIAAGTVRHPAQLRIVQWDAQKAANMRSLDAALGPRVVTGAVQEYLSAESPNAARQTDGAYAGLYLDVCGTIDAQLLPALDGLLTHPAQREAGWPVVLGATWCARDPLGNTSEASECHLD